MSGKDNGVTIIKKVVEDGHHGHHGGGWKVAYADFMTAMMAFFLLLWILAASDEEALRGLADYFTPSLSDAGGKGQGMLAGMVMAEDGIMSGTDGEKSEVQLPSFGEENPLKVFDSRLRDQPPEVVIEYQLLPEGARPEDVMENPGDEAEPTDSAEDAAAAAAAAAALAAAMEAREDAFEQIEAEITEAVAADPELADLGDNLRFEITPEGLLVQLVDEQKRSLFKSGSAAIEGETRELVTILGQALQGLENDVKITGHTDAVPFTNRSGYSNWELSADRANATRRVLTEAGVVPERMAGISGLAATRPIDPANPEAAENRRIDILVAWPEPKLPE